jgi:hypothetical protein
MAIRAYKTKKSLLISTFVVLFLAAQTLLPMLVRQSLAGTLSQGFVRTDRMNTSQTTTGTVCAKTNGTAQTEAAAGVTFPTGYTVSTTLGNWSVSTATTTGWPAGANAWPGIAQPTSGQIVGQTVVFGSSDLTASTLYCFNWTTAAGLTTKSSATNDNTGTIYTCNANTTNCAGLSTHTADLDSINYAIATVTSDQINVTASINPSFQMSFSGGTTDALGTLTTGAVASSSTVTMTVNTNAKNGWMAWIKDSSSGLNSTAAGYTISSTGTPGIGNASSALSAPATPDAYNVGIAFSQTSGTCTAGSAVNANFDKGGGANKGGSIDTTLRTILTCSGTSNGGVITPTNFAAINGATPAATDYTDTQTYVAAGLF